MHRCETGVAAVEFAFIGMILIMLTLGIVEFGRGFYVYNKLSYAVDLAARKLLTTPTVTDQQLKAEVAGAFKGEKTAPTVTVTSGSTGTGSGLVKFKTVQISMPFQLLVPNVVRNAFNISISRRIPLIL